jgi:exopolysaccharide biosynthesis WecB/TagA/CpsF family protein
MNEYALLRSIKPLSESEFTDDIFSSEISVKLVSFCNAQALDLASRNEQFFSAIMNSDYILRDGIGTKLALKTLGKEIGDNLNGTDLIPKIIDYSGVKKIILFGSEDKILKKAKVLIDGIPGKEILAMANGFDFEDDYYCKLMSDFKDVDLVILAMGMPKQEVLSVKLKSAAIYNNQNTIIVNGGAILSFIAGEESRAPRLVREIGLEWVWRMLNDPSRLISRYFSNAVLLIKMVSYKVFK